MRGYSLQGRSDRRTPDPSLRKDDLDESLSDKDLKTEGHAVVYPSTVNDLQRVFSGRQSWAYSLIASQSPQGLTG